MQHISGRQIIGFCDFGFSGGFRLLLRRHDAGTSQPKLYSRIGMDRIVDTAVARDKASQHLAVGRINNGIHRQPGDVALPQINAGSYRRQFFQAYCAPLGKPFFKVRILYL